MLKNPLPHILFFVVSITLFSCGEKASDEIYSGKLEELIEGELTFNKDYETKYLHNLRTVPGNEDWLFLTSGLPNYEGIIIKFFELESNKKVIEVIIPNEGPEALKGGAGGHYFVKNSNEIFLVGSAGKLGKYDREGKKIEELEVNFNLPSSREDFILLESRKGLMYMDGDWIQIGQNPSNSMKFFDPKVRLLKSEFPLDFNTWLSQINVKTGQVRHSDFKIPEGYGKFQNDMTSTYLMGTFDSKRQDYYLAWPYSDTIYHLKNLNVVNKFKPASNVDFNFIPSEVIPWGKAATVWALPKEASQNIFLLYDQWNDLYVHLSKTHESGEGETKFERTKHYVLSFYSGDWQPLGEYFFDFEGELDLENWFLTGGRLFINKPEQPNEDQYEFYKIDLSKVKK